MRPDSPVFHIPAGFWVEGPLEDESLRRALRLLTARHEALRTRFVLDGDAPMQEVLESVEPELELEELPDAPEHASEEGRAALALTRAREAARRPFDITRAPLLRTTLLRLTPERALLVLTVHHIVSEVQSVGLLARDLAHFLAAESGSEETALEALPKLERNFGDYAAWQRARAAEGAHEEHLTYWSGALAPPLPTLELPTDRPRPATQDFDGATCTRPLPDTLAARLTSFATSSGQTLFAPLFAAYATVLARYADASDLLVGIPMTDRDRSELEDVVGFFVNTLVLRAQVREDTSFRELCTATAQRLLDAQAHQELPFERLVETLAPERDLSRSPLFQVAFLLQYESEGGMQPIAAGARRELVPLDPLALHTETSKFDLALIAYVGDGTLRLGAEYQRDLFDAATIERLLAHIQLVLEGALDAPEAPLVELPLLTPGEKQLLFERWNATTVEHPFPELDSGLAQRAFEHHAARDPHALAVRGRGAELTYGELEQRANRLAHHLRTLGVGRDVPVAVACERRVEMVVGILAALKAGGAYLPFDLSYPLERLRFQLDDAGAPVLLSHSDERAKLPPFSGHTLLLDELEPTLSALPATPPETQPGEDDPERLAYVIYTSGSTGRPKGVGVPHRGLLNLVGWHRRAYGVTPADRATHLAGLAFDASVWELWPYLTAGASLHLVEDDVRLAPRELYSWLAREGITISFLATPLAEALLLEEPPAGLALRYVLTGGDKLRSAPRRSHPFVLVNHYGPTENSVVATACEVPPATDAHATASEDTSGVPIGTAPPIGHPIDNVRVHLLDERGRHVPIGVPGELHLAGESLARGYFGREDLTRDRFVPDTSGREERLYRTGDLCRWRPLPDGSGTLAFLGRIDGQVKVRGFRIELGEIEARLAEHPSVRECACALQSSSKATGGSGGATNGDAWIAGYVVPADASAAFDGESLRSHLRALLPDYMCPSAFMPLDALPLTPNGKLDRRALPVPELGDQASSARPFVAPEGELQTRIAAVWAEVLSNDEIDAHANFFDVGGHSLSMARVHVRLQEELGRTLPIVELFQYPSVSALAAHLESDVAPVAAAEGLDRAANRLARRGRRQRRRPGRTDG